MKCGCHWLSRVLLYLLTILSMVARTEARETAYTIGTGLDGVTRRLAVDRTPALYTGDVGECLGGQSLFNVTRFDAGLYYDNSSVTFHLGGSTNLKDTAVMLYISVVAYGEKRFGMTVDPCTTQIYSLCPLNANNPIQAYARFGISPQDMADIPKMAFEIPDFEGLARIQIFDNSSKLEIGCFQAVMRNGNTFAQPAIVISILAGFTVAAIISSFLTAAYGVSIRHMRTHYAHSVSVLVILETFQAIFFSGALSVEWPSVLPAWWSNFAWSCGIISLSGLVRSIDGFAGVLGNSSQVGSAGWTVINNNGGLSQQIYGRSLSPGLVERAAAAVATRHRYDADNPDDYNWAGDAVSPGMPLPGTWTGFAGSLAQLGVPAADAFLIAVIWVLVAMGAVAVSITVFKLSLEGLARMKWIKEDRLAYFRSHWKAYLGLALLRTVLAAFFSIVTLAIFQLAKGGRAGTMAIAAVVLACLLVGMGGLAVYALHFRLRNSRLEVKADRIILQPTKVLKCIPSLLPLRLSRLKEKECRQKAIGSLPFVRCHFVDHDPNRPGVHQDQAFIKRFGWLTARYRLSRWWFFIFWLGYQLVRACFIAGAASKPLVQVFGVFVVDVFALVAIAAINPYEGRRNSGLGVRLLAVNKIITGGLSIAFLPAFGLNRISATVIGVIIIIMQALVALAVLILITLGIVSSRMSLTRNQEYFSPQRLEGIRIRYFEHLEFKALDQTHATPPPNEPVEPVPKAKSILSRRSEVPTLETAERSFNVTSVRRAPKIEDEDDDMLSEMQPVMSPSPANRARRTNSTSSRVSVRSIPRAARVHRTSWTSPHSPQSGSDMDRPSSALLQRLQADRPVSVSTSRSTTDRDRVAGANRSCSSTPLGHRRRALSPSQELSTAKSMPALTKPNPEPDAGKDGGGSNTESSSL